MLKTTICITIKSGTQKGPNMCNKRGPWYYTLPLCFQESFVGGQCGLILLELEWAFIFKIASPLLVQGFTLLVVNQWPNNSVSLTTH